MYTKTRPSGPLTRPIASGMRCSERVGGEKKGSTLQVFAGWGGRFGGFMRDAVVEGLVLLLLLPPEFLLVPLGRLSPLAPER